MDKKTRLATARRLNQILRGHARLDVDATTVEAAEKALGGWNVQQLAIDTLAGHRVSYKTNQG